VIEPPETRYARSDDLHIAYQVVGDGDRDLVHVPGSLDTLEVSWQLPGIVRFYEHLARFTRLILFDKRATGSSDRLAPGSTPTLEDRIDDVRAVMDAVDSERATLFAVADGGPVAMLFAATYPERTNGLILQATSARTAWAPDTPWGASPEVIAALIGAVEREWGAGFTARFFPSTDSKIWGRMERLVGTPRDAAAIYRTSFETDVRSALPAIATPTLITHHTNHPLWPVEGARFLAEHIPNARLVELPGEVRALGTDAEADEFLAREIEELMTGSSTPVESERVLKTVLFTDIVDSTARATALGDRRWRDLLDEHDTLIGREVNRARGSVVNTTGDGFLASFDGPARAIRCAEAIVAAAKRLDIDVRIGLHTGECEVRGDDLAGIAVHIGARVAALAQPGQVLVTSTVRDLVAGSGIEFTDRGRHELKGVSGEWQLLAVTTGGESA
jgi:class 3 adenylate cyclase